MTLISKTLSQSQTYCCNDVEQEAAALHQVRRIAVAAEAERIDVRNRVSVYVCITVQRLHRADRSRYYITVHETADFRAVLVRPHVVKAVRVGHHAIANE